MHTSGLATYFVTFEWQEEQEKELRARDEVLAQQRKTEVRLLQVKGDHIMICSMAKPLSYLVCVR